MNKKWEYYESDNEKVKEISNKFNISNLLAKILINRNVIEDEQIRMFLTPTRNDFYDPFLMPDMEIAVNRIIKAIENKEKVIIYGDYAYHDVFGAGRVVEVTNTLISIAFKSPHGIKKLMKNHKSIKKV